MLWVRLATVRGGAGRTTQLEQKLGLPGTLGGRARRAEARATPATSPWHDAESRPGEQLHQ